jgi:hypothetical protein
MIRVISLDIELAIIIKFDIGFCFQGNCDSNASSSTTNFQVQGQATAFAIAHESTRQRQWLAAAIKLDGARR